MARKHVQKATTPAEQAPPADNRAEHSAGHSEDEEDLFPSKQKLRPARDVYNRLRWENEYYEADGDQNQNENVPNEAGVLPDNRDEQVFRNVFIGYMDRMTGLCEISLAEFVPFPDGDIPYHRIWYFRSSDLLIWDRLARLDYVFLSGETVQRSAPGANDARPPLSFKASRYADPSLIASVDALKRMYEMECK